MLRLALTAFLATVAAPALAADDPATACVQTKVWDARQKGWALRALDSVQLYQAQMSAWPVAMAPGVTYKVIACGDKGIATLDLVLVDSNGAVVGRAAEGNGREPFVDTKPSTATKLHVVVRPREAAPDALHHTAIAILYR